jgi:glucose-1-phosphate thymidylyltransferase
LARHRTHESLIEASEFVHILEQRQGTRIACIEEIAFRMDFIDKAQLEKLAVGYGKSDYGKYLRACAAES